MSDLYPSERMMRSRYKYFGLTFTATINGNSLLTTKPFVTVYVGHPDVVATGAVHVHT